MPDIVIPSSGGSSSPSLLSLTSTLSANLLAITSATASTFPRQNGYQVPINLTSGTVNMVAIALPSGLVVNNITFFSGAAVNAPTHQYFALCNSSRLVLRATADDTSTAWLIHTAKTLALTSPFTTTYAGLHYLAILITATGTPQIFGQDTADASLHGAAPILCGTADAGQTSIPSTVGAITATTGFAYAELS